MAPYKYVKGGISQIGTDKVSEPKEEYGKKQKFFELEVVSESELTKIFIQSHQALWGGGQRNPSVAFDELDKLIFCKIWDEKHPRKNGEPYDFQIFRGEDTEDLLKRIKKIYAIVEKEVTKDNPIEVVLVSAGSIKNLKKAYPNYFLDTKDFVRQLEIIKKLLTKQST